jgi:hypothetical protein
MKRIRLGFLALAVIIGIGSAFTIKHTVKFTGRTYAIHSENSNGTYSVSLWKPGYRCVGFNGTCRFVYPDNAITLTLVQSNDQNIVDKTPGAFTSGG